MKKQYLGNSIIIGILALTLAACGGPKNAKKPIEEKAPIKSGEQQDNTGGYYKDDGPGDNIPADLDSIPDATPKYEEYSTRANQPYIALEKRYTPMTSYTPYQKEGMASWYGKRYHGGKTSTGEIYDMYGMTAAHKTLPIPSYARVTNLSNGKSVVVRINDRGPFINGRIIDLSYVAAHKLNIIKAGQGKVLVEAIDTRAETLRQATQPVAADAVNRDILPVEPMSNESHSIGEGVFVQVGAFQSQQNSQKLMEQLAGFKTTGNATVFQELSANQIYRVKIGPYANREAAEAAKNKLMQQFGISAIIQTP